MSGEQRTEGFEERYQDSVEESEQHNHVETKERAEVRTPLGQAAAVAQTQATQAVDALRHGEFIHDTRSDPEANADDRLIALLTYASQALLPLIMPLIVLLSENGRVRSFQRYHAVQSLGLTATFMIIGVSMSIATTISQIIPPLGLLVAIIMICLTPVLMGMYVIAMFYYGYQSYKGNRFAIPGLTNFLRAQGWL